MLIIKIDTYVVLVLFSIEVDFLELVVEHSVCPGLTNHLHQTDYLHYISTHDDRQNRNVVVL